MIYNIIPYISLHFILLNNYAEADALVELVFGRKSTYCFSKLQLFMMTFVAQKDLQNQMCSLPIRSDTMRVRQQKAELDKKLAEVEEAIKIFSREKVFVKLDE